MCFGSLSHVKKPEKNQIATGAAIRSSQGTFRSSFQKRRMRGSLTTEAALALPICLGVLLILGCLIRAMRIYEAVDVSLCSAARRAAAYSSAEGGIKKSKAVLFFYEEMKLNHADTSLIRGGLAGIRISIPEEGKDDGMIRMQAAFRMKFPGLMIRKKTLSVRNSVYTRAWTGIPYGKKGKGSGSGEKERHTVMVADNGVVYHTDENCTYLDLSVHSVSAKSVGSLRNQYGRRYVPCEKCAHGEGAGKVYITRQGEAWHMDRNCSGLKRSLQLLTEEEAHHRGLRPCPRCGH